MSAFDYDGELITEDTSSPLCPYCGYEIEDWYDYSELGRGENTEIICSNCEKEYEVEPIHDITFNNARIDQKARAADKVKAQKAQEERRREADKFTPGMRVVMISSYRKGGTGSDA